MTKLIAPEDVHPYFDKIQFWLPSNVDAATERLLKQQCGKGGYYKRLGPARFDDRLRCRIELKQPSNVAVERVAQMKSAFVNRVEISLDLVFNTATERDEAFEFLSRHWIRLWHSKRQGM